ARTCGRAAPFSEQRVYQRNRRRRVTLRGEEGPLMRRLLWPSVLVATFLVGWATGGVVRQPPTLRAGADPDHETIARLQNQVDTLQARLRAREDLAMRRESGGTSQSPAPADDRV